ncbi:MAG: site-specific integrase [Lachnospiraceae bacterium]|nr:site-specific integrase [Lachnospiraceae bacterium]
MASIRERNGKFNVIYSYTDPDGKRKQKWETYATKAEAKKRKKEIEYKEEMGSMVIPQCKTMKELLEEYVALYGKDNWALSTYDGNVSLINNYILPIIGDVKLAEINTRYIEKYYQRLLKTPAVINPMIGKRMNEYVSTSTIRDIHKLLRSCFQQAIKWELMEKNPCIYATVPKHKSKKRDIWTAETLMYAMEVCEDERLKLAMNLSFSCSLRISELLGLTWDCVDISEEAIEENRAYLFINKESQRVSKAALKELDAKDVLLVFPEKSKKNKTVRVLKTPKTDSSGTYKLKLNGGDIKAVQGDSGHAQVSMVTDVYSHILDDDRKKNAELFEEAFYEKKNLDPQMHPNTAENTVTVPEGVDAELLAKVLNNPEMAALLTSLAKTMK